MKTKSIPKKLLTIREKTIEVIEAFEVFVAKLEEKYGVRVKYNLDDVINYKPREKKK